MLSGLGEGERTGCNSEILDSSLKAAHEESLFGRWEIEQAAAMNRSPLNARAARMPTFM